MNDTPPELPSGKYCKLAYDGQGRFSVVTERLGFVVGDRLDRGRGNGPPDGPTTGLTLRDAEAALEAWEAFCYVQNEDKGEKIFSQKPNRNNGLRDGGKENARNDLQDGQRGLL